MNPRLNNPKAEVCPYAHSGRGSHQAEAEGLFFSRKEMNEEEREKKLEYSRKYRISHRFELREKGKIWTKENKHVRTAYYRNHKESILKHQKAYYDANKEEINARRRAFRKENPSVERSWKLKANYGISLKEFNSILEIQNGNCAICKKSEWKWRGPVVDHDHHSGRVRGILCHNCNLAIGHINEEPQIAKSMSDYLEKFMMAVMTEEKKEK